MLRLLLDTHVLLWALADNRLLPAPAERLILVTDDANIRRYNVAVLPA